MFDHGLMTDDDWLQVAAIPKSDKRHNYGDANRIDRAVILTLEMFARVENHSPLITSGTGGVHTKDSYHYKGQALDFMLPKMDLQHLPDVLFNLLRYPFTGIGIYSEWKLQQDGKRVGGFHVDMRTVARRALWVKGPKGYEAMTLANLKRYFV